MIESHFVINAEGKNNLPKRNMNTKNKKKDWEKEFDKKFVGDNRSDGIGYQCSIEVKQFISQAIQESREEVISNIRKWLKGRNINEREKNLIREYLNKQK